jgi:6-phosphogluconolactonase
VHFFWGDERCVPPESRDSNFGMASDALLSKIRVPEANIHRIPGELPDPQQTAQIYEAELRRWSSGAVPRFDVVLLGLGADCHTASLFPEGRWRTDRLTEVAYAPQPPATRITMTPRTLNNAQDVLFLVAGSSKAAALAAALEGPAERCPAALIRPDRGTVVWLVDEAAASALKKRRATDFTD